MDSENIKQKFIDLKNKSGSHSPSVFAIKKFLPEINIDVDACFLSNPYATDLFMRFVENDLIKTGLLRDTLEFYPSQNRIISLYLSDYLNIDPAYLFVGNGATEIIQAIMHTFVKGKVLINIPTFSPYYEFAKGCDVIYNTLEEKDGFVLNIDKFCNTAINESVDTVVIINPNNPDGSYIKKSDILKILDRLKSVNNIILDESFIHFAFENDEYEIMSCIKEVLQYKNLVVLKSMSKDFGIAGVRSGFAIMNPDRVTKLLRNGFLWNVSGLSEYFFSLHSNNAFVSEYETLRKIYIAETQEFFYDLSLIDGLKIYDSKANFALAKLEHESNSIDFVSDALINSGVYFRSCDDKFGLGKNFIRIASRTKEENQKILMCIQKYGDEKWRR